MITIESTFNAKVYKAFYRYDAYWGSGRAKSFVALLVLLLGVVAYGFIAANMQFVWVGGLLFVFLGGFYIYKEVFFEKLRYLENFF